MTSFSIPTLSLSALCAALALLPPTVNGQEEGVSKGAIVKAFSSPNSLIRHDTWTKMNPEDKSQFKYLVNIMAKKPWFDRDGTIKALATAASDEVLEKMIKDLQKHKDRAVRQGMAVALAKMDDPIFYKHLYDALDDKDPTVRRVVVHSLRVHKKPEAVDALVKRFQKEDDPVVKTFLESSLNELTQAYRGPKAEYWLSWWETAKNDPDYKLGETDEDAKKAAEDLGHKLKKRRTVSILGGVTLESSERGSGIGVPILIIPPYGYSENIMLPFLSGLEQRHKLHYIKLPPVRSFKNLRTVSAKNIPYYPIDQLVDAFEDLRKQTNEERFAIMACGMNSWIAMRYAKKYPKSVAGILLVAPLSGVKEYARATDRFEKQGKGKKDTEMHYFGLTRRFNSQTGESNLDSYQRENEITKWEGEGGCIDRRSWSLFFHDERDYVISMLYPVKNHVMGSVAIPDFDLFKEQKPALRIPTLVITGKSSLYNSIEDSKGIAKYYRGICIVYSFSSCMPFCEESKRFNKDVAGFLKKFARVKKDKSKK